MLNIKIICVGKLKEKFYSDASNEYIKRLSGYCKLEIIEIPEYRLPPGNTIHGNTRCIESGAMDQNPETVGQVIKETNVKDARIALALGKERIAIAEKLPAEALTVALCIEGREMDSCGLSEFLSGCAIRGTSRLCFIIGGSFGLHDDIKNGANLLLSISKMTFPHSLARIVLLEQLYRAFNISEGGKYHK